MTWVSDEVPTNFARQGDPKAGESGIVLPEGHPQTFVDQMSTNRHHLVAGR
jgi:hypothetical protein